jgi:hypothetical protein
MVSYFYVCLPILFAIVMMPLPDVIVHPIGNFMISAFEANQIPDAISRLGTKMLLRMDLANDRARAGPEGSEQERQFLQNFTADLKTRGIAELTTKANEQHYEVDTRFYTLVLGKHRKYSSALFPTATTDVSQALNLLDEAEERMLHVYAQRARITTDDSFRIMFGHIVVCGQVSKVNVCRFIKQ